MTHTRQTIQLENTLARIAPELHKRVHAALVGFTGKVRLAAGGKSKAFANAIGKVGDSKDLHPHLRWHVDVSAFSKRVYLHADVSGPSGIGEAWHYAKTDLYLGELVEGGTIALAPLPDNQPVVRDFDAMVAAKAQADALRQQAYQLLRDAGVCEGDHFRA